MVSASAASEVVTVVLPVELVLASLADVRRQLVALAGHAARCAIDARAVRTIDGAGAQLLVAFVLDVQRRVGAPSWIAVSPALAEIAAALGLHRVLALPEPAR